MSKPKVRDRKLYPVKLTRAQWNLVTEATYEWGYLCEGDSDMADGSYNKKMKARGLKLQDLAATIGAQLLERIRMARGGEGSEAAK